MRINNLLKNAKRPQSWPEGQTDHASTRARQALWSRISSMTIIMIVGAAAMFVGFSQFADGAERGLLGVAAVICLAGAAFSFASEHNGNKSAAIAAQSVAIFCSGVLLAYAAPQFAAAGLALSALSIVHALVLIGRSSPIMRVGLMIALTALLVVGVTWIWQFWLDANINFSAQTAILGFLVVGAIETLSIGQVLIREIQSGDRKDRSFQQTVDAMGVAAITLSASGEVDFVSDKTAQLFGCLAFELNGTGLIKNIHLLDRPAFLKAASDTNHTGKPVAVEARVRKQNSDPKNRSDNFVWTEFYFCKTNPHASEKLGQQTFATIRDITARKDKEHLLAETQALAKQTDESKSAFLATMGHELRTPLNAIVGFAQMMTNGIGGQLHPTHDEYAHHIEQSGRHLLDVVNMLLDMSKLDAGKFELHLTEFEPSALVDPSVHIIKGLAEQNQVQLIANVPKMLPHMLGDESACRQILINLLSNAVKFSEPGAKVELSIRRQGTKLCLSVSDSGIGMTPANARRLGEPFFQINSGLDRKYEGTGLGMSIVKGLIRLHDGKFQVETELGKGTTITVLLPLNGPTARSHGSDNQITEFPINPISNEISPWPEKQRIA